jgi:hypothetical protein
MDDERMKILKRVEAGELSAQDAVRLINALGPTPAGEPEPEVIEPDSPQPSAPPLEAPKSLAQFWIYLLYAGVGVVVLGALMLYAVYGARGGWGYALCGWPIFFAGVLVIATAWWLRTARWVHVRVRGKDTARVAISIPLPLKLTAWAFRIAKPFVPQLKDTGIDEVILGMADALGQDGQPLYVDVNDDDKGEHVQVYIG